LTRYAALLGSINVGGNRMKMAELRAALEEAGFANFATVVASGNVLFDHEAVSDSALAQRIAQVVKDRFGIDSFAAVRDRGELEAAIAGNPFASDGEPNLVHTVFLAQPLDCEAFEHFAQGYPGPERIAPGVREYFVDYAENVGRSKLDPAMAKAKVIRSRATARNIRSLRRIVDAMD
jgi:uncharacterized protein (DUF1697 family)